MLKDAFPIHGVLVDSTRLPTFSQHSSAVDQVKTAEVAWLLGLGIGAGVATSLLDFGLRLPGHAILRSIPLIALGIGTVPRRNAGWLIGAGALVGLLSVRLFGGPLPGLGAGTSLLLLGPVLELALRSAKSGWRVYFSFALAGLAGNSAAFLMRAIPKVLGLEVARGRPLGGWLATAAVSYAICGVLAGLLSAAICFRAGTRDRAPT